MPVWNGLEEWVSHLHCRETPALPETSNRYNWPISWSFEQISAWPGFRNCFLRMCKWSLRPWRRICCNKLKVMFWEHSVTMETNLIRFRPNWWWFCDDWVMMKMMIDWTRNWCLISNVWPKLSWSYWSWVIVGWRSRFHCSSLLMCIYIYSMFKCAHIEHAYVYIFISMCEHRCKLDLLKVICKLSKAFPWSWTWNLKCQHQESYLGGSDANFSGSKISGLWSGAKPDTFLRKCRQVDHSCKQRILVSYGVTGFGVAVRNMLNTRLKNSTRPWALGHRFQIHRDPVWMCLLAIPSQDRVNLGK